MVADATILNQIKNAVVAVDPTAEVILFGSRARGDCHEESDWDILVLVNNYTWELKNKLIDQIFQVQLKQEIAISVMVRGKSYWERIKRSSLYREVEKQGVVL